MSIHFDQIPSEIEINLEVPKTPTVAEELEAAQELLNHRTTKCQNIKPIYKREKRQPVKYSYKFYCFCPRYNPNYLCKHSRNVIIDRDVLTTEEHICYLATPKSDFAAPRKKPRYYQKKVVLPNCTARIEELALPDLKRVRETLQSYKHLLSHKQSRILKEHLMQKPEVQYTGINTALDYMDEERRLRRVAKIMEKRRCKRVKKNILRKQRRQIRKIICILFEEMRDFLLNDQFLIDEKSTLCLAILEKIKDFTETEFYTTSNLREYQQVLANNLTVWINKFISNLNIHVAPLQPKAQQVDMESFLPVANYIPCSDSIEAEEFVSDYFNVAEEEWDFNYNTDVATDDTLRDTNL